MSYPSINQNSKFDFNIKHSLHQRGPALGFPFSNFVPKEEEGAAIRRRQKDDRKSVNWPWTIRNHFVLSGPAHSEDQLKDTLHWGPLFLKFPLSRLLSWFWWLFWGCLVKYTPWDQASWIQTQLSLLLILHPQCLALHLTHNNLSLSTSWVIKMKDNLHISKLSKNFLPLTKLTLKFILGYWSHPLLWNYLPPSRTIVSSLFLICGHVLHFQKSSLLLTAPLTQAFPRAEWVSFLLSLLYTVWLFLGLGNKSVIPVRTHSYALDPHNPLTMGHLPSHRDIKPLVLRCKCILFSKIYPRPQFL